MATDFYLGSSGTPEVSPSYSADWDVTTDAVRRPLSGFPRNSTMTTKAYTDSDETDQNILLFQFVSAPMDAGTTGAPTMLISIRGVESNAGNNMFLSATARLVDINGDDYDTPKVIIAFGLDDVEFDATTLTSRSFMMGAITDTTIAEGDRLVIEIGGSGNPDGGQSHGFSLSYGDDSAANLVTTSDVATGADNPRARFNTGTLDFYGNKFYLPADTGTVAPVSPGYSVNWDDTSQVKARLDLPRTPTGTVMKDHSISDASTANLDILIMQYVSPPLHPFSTTKMGSKVFDYVIRASETAASVNMDVRATVRIVKNDGTEYGTPEFLVGPSLTAADTSEASTTLTARSITTTLLNNNVTIADGDRLVVEFGMGGNPSGASGHTGLLSFGDDSETDLANGNSETAAYNPWVYFVNPANNHYLPFKWPVAASSTTYYETPSMTMAGANGLVIYVKTTKSIAAAGSVSVALENTWSKVLGITADMTSSVSKYVKTLKEMVVDGTSGFIKAVKLTKMITAAGSASASFANIFTKAIGVAMGGVSTMSRLLQYYRTSASSTGGSNIFSRSAQYPRSFGYTVAGVAGLAYGTVLGIIFSITMAGSAGMTKANIWAIAGSVTATMGSTVAKLVKLTKTATSAMTSSLSQGKIFLESFAVTMAGAVSLTRANIWTLTLSSTMSGAVTISKYVKVLKGVATGSIASMVKKITPTAKQITMAGTVGFAQGLKFIQVAMMTCGMSVTLSTAMIVVIGGQIASGWVLSITRKIVTLMTAKFVP